MKLDKFISNNKQLIEWLEELKELRKYKKSTPFQDGYTKALNDIKSELRSICNRYYTDKAFIYYDDLLKCINDMNKR